MKKRQFLKGVAIALTLASSISTGMSAFAADMKVLKIGRSPVGQFEPLIIGMQQGYFADVGIELELSIGSSPDQAIASVVAGSLDIAMSGVVPTVAAASKGVPVLTIINTQDQGEVRTFGLLVKPDSDIKSIKDLKGKKIGLPGIASPQGIGLLLELEANGIKPDEVELVNLPFPGVLSAMESGAVDAGMPIALFYGLALQKGYREFEAVYDRTVGTPAVIYVASKSWIAENEDTLKDFNSALKLAYDFANKNPDVIRAIDKEYTKLPHDYLDSRNIVDFTAVVSVSNMQELNENTMKFGFLSSIPEVDDYIWSGADKR